jgi:putative hydrolase of the HAD superfamily
MKNANIDHYFATITNSETAGVKKPNPIIFEHAINLSQAKAENSIMIGDCIEADVRGALNAGIDAILFGSQCDDHKIKRVSTLAELKNYL